MEFVAHPPTLNHTVEDEVVVVTVAAQCDKVFHCLRALVQEERDGDVACMVGVQVDSPPVLSSAAQVPCIYRDVCTNSTENIITHPLTYEW